MNLQILEKAPKNLAEGESDRRENLRNSCILPSKSEGEDYYVET